MVVYSRIGLSPFGADDVAQEGIFLVVTCTWIEHPHTHPSDVVVVDQVCWLSHMVTCGSSCSLEAVDAPVPPFGAQRFCAQLHPQTDFFPVPGVMRD